MHDKKRVLYLAAGTLILLFAGFVYAWSVVSAPIAAEYPQWAEGAFGFTFTLCMMFFCLGGLAAGLLAGRVGARLCLLFAALLFPAGFFLSAAAQSLGALYLGYGVCCGTAAGFAYNAVMRSVPLYFPDKRGLASGVLLMGFGASSLLFGSAFSAAVPLFAGGWRSVMRLCGAAMAVAMLLGALLLREPAAQKGAQGETEAEGMRPAAVLRASNFWFFFLWATLLSMAGLAVIGQGMPLARAAGPGAAAGLLSLSVGLISVCNGLGRVLFGALYDRFGWKRTMRLINLLFLAAPALLFVSSSLPSFPLLLLGFALTGLGYGGIPIVNASFAREFFGPKHYAVNYQFLVASLLPASFAGTLSGLALDAGGGFVSIFIAMAAGALAALLLLSRIRKDESGAGTRKREKNA